MNPLLHRLATLEQIKSLGKQVEIIRLTSHATEQEIGEHDETIVLECRGWKQTFHRKLGETNETFLQRADDCAVTAAREALPDLLVLGHGDGDL